MTQGFLNQITDTSTESGDDLAERINRYDAAMKTGQAGTSRPGGLGAGGTWSRDNEDGTFTRMIYNGVNDAPVSPSVLDEDDFASDSSTQAPSQQSVLALIRALMGFANIWQDLTASRAVNTIYTNTTGTVIYVGVQSTVTLGNAEPYFEVSSDGSTWSVAGLGHYDTDSNARRRMASGGPIPVYPGERYRLAANNVEMWLERRPAP